MNNEELSDSIWGEGNWIRCPTCPKDSNGEDVYHHKDAHKELNGS